MLVVYTFYKTFQDDRQTDGHFTAATTTALDEVLVLEEKPSKKFREPVLKSIWNLTFSLHFIMLSKGNGAYH